MEEAFYIFIIIVSAAISLACFVIIGFVILEGVMERKTQAASDEAHEEWKASRTCYTHNF